MTQISVSEATNRKEPHCTLFVVRNASTKDIMFQIYLEGRFKYYNGDSEDTVKFDLEETEVESTFEPVAMMKYQKMIHNDILMNNVNEDLLYEYVQKFENIRPWLKCVYEPKWKESLGDEFYKYVRDYIKNDLYLFCCSFPGLEAYIDNIGKIK